MIVRRLEALADAITRYSGFADPESEEYQIRNPGRLTAFSDKHARTPNGKRVFRSLLDGYQALLFDLAVKCVGKSNSGLKPASTLTDLVLVYGFPPGTVRFVAKFLRHALGDETVKETTPLSYFVTE